MSSLSVLIVASISIGFIHTVSGPDHYLPFIVMSRARNWSKLKTLLITLVCGLGHVLSSVVIGSIGIIFGIAVHRLEFLEGIRGNIAGWAFIAFGLVYMVWGIRNAIKNKPHTHSHNHSDGYEHTHEHTHEGEHIHIHEGSGSNITPWVLFTIFVLGPCEPLIPLLLYPAAEGSVMNVALVAIVFGVITIATMLSMVMLFSYVTSLFRLGWFEKYTHAIAGGIIALSGVAIQFMGL